MYVHTHQLSVYEYILFILFCYNYIIILCLYYDIVQIT